LQLGNRKPLASALASKFEGWKEFGSVARGAQLGRATCGYCKSTGSAAAMTTATATPSTDKLAITEASQAASRSSCRMVLHISALRVLGRPCGHASRLYQTPQRSRAAGSGEGPRLARRHPNLTVIATGHPLCRPRSARRSESSSSVVPFAKMKESARSSNTAVTRFSLERCSWILCMALSSR
jgi:hypothetical protein